MRRTQRGFSLVEVIVVMAIISVLMGFGIGMYRRLASVGAAQQAGNTLTDTIAQVKTSSKAYPSALVIDPVGRVIYGIEFRTVQNCNFEERDDLGIVGLAHKYGKFAGGQGRLEPYPWGHTGGAAVCEPGGIINFGNYPDYDLIEGVSIDVWVYPTANQSMGVIRKGDSYGIRLMKGNGGPVVEGFLRLSKPGAKNMRTSAPAEYYKVRKHPLLLNRWNRIIFNYDRTAITIAIDSYGRGAVERFRQLESDVAGPGDDLETAADKALRLAGRVIVPDLDADLIAGDEPGWLIGRIDDLKVAGILSGRHNPLPDDVELLGVIRKIRFRDNKLDPSYHRGPETIVLKYKGVETPITIGTLGNIIDR